MSGRYPRPVYCDYCHELIERKRDLIVASVSILSILAFHKACFARIRDRARYSQNPYQVISGEEGEKLLYNSCIKGALLGAGWAFILGVVNLVSASTPGRDLVYMSIILTPIVFIVVLLYALTAIRIGRAARNYRHLPK